MATGKLKIALVQLAVGAVKSENLANALQKIKLAAEQGSQIIALPECFNSPYGADYFNKYAEEIPGESTSALSKAAKEHKVYLVGGSIPERDCQQLYNTCTVWDPNGTMVAKHRKVHMFDINIPGGITVTESDSLSPGSKFTTFDHPLCKIGVGICYDIRFAEMAQIYAKKGCNLLLYPGAFNTTTGPLHWELLQRARAVDNQVYVASISPARDTSASYHAWGHSMVVSPMGEVLASTEEKEDIVYAELDLDFVEKTRSMIPVTYQKRNDLYEVKEK